MNEWSEIRRRVLVEGMSKRAACREYGLGWWTLDKILTHAEPPGYRMKAPRSKPKLARFVPVIEAILEADKTAPPKQRHTARRIFERLRDEYGYTGCKLGFGVVRLVLEHLRSPPLKPERRGAPLVSGGRHRAPEGQSSTRALSVAWSTT